MQFRPAHRSQRFLRLLLAGPSGSGKTYSALRVAFGLDAGKVALLDTERSSASLYAGVVSDGIPWAFDVADIEPPHSPEKYADAIRTAEAAGYGVLIVDGLTALWGGIGGLNDIVDDVARARHKGNTWAAWGDVRPREKAFWDVLTGSKMHIICTARVKTEWATRKDERTGKSTPEKLGMKPEQRDGLEYEFDLALRLDQDHNLDVDKTRVTTIPRGSVMGVPGPDLIGKVKAWLTTAEPPAAPVDPLIERRAKAAAWIAGQGVALADVEREMEEPLADWSGAMLDSVPGIVRRLKAAKADPRDGGDAPDDPPSVIDPAVGGDA